MPRTVKLSKQRLFALALFALAPAAHAGHWVTTYQGGKGAFTYSYPQAGHDYAEDPATKRWGGGGNYAYGTIVATLTWTPDFTGDTSPPPQTIYVLETCEAKGRSTPSGQPTADADNGLKSPKSVVNQVQPYPFKAATSVGKRITYMQTGGTTVVVLPSVSPSAQGSYEASVWYSAKVTDYAVTIWSDRDESFHREGGTTVPPNAPVPVTRVSNDTNVLTPRFGDTWVDPNTRLIETSLEGDKPYYTSAPTFLASLVGPWQNPFYEWDVDGTVFSGNYTTVSKLWKIYEPKLKEMGSDGSLTKLVKLKVTDATGISADATYTLRLHNPYDNWVKNRSLLPIFEAVQSFTIDSPGYAQSGGGIGCHWYEGGAEWAVMRDVANALEPIGSGLLQNPIYAAGFSAAMIFLADAAPRPDHGIAPWAWNSPGSTISGGPWTDNIQAYDMIPALEIGYDRILQDADAYDYHGFTGLAHDVKTKRNGLKRWTGHFTRRAGSGWGPQP